MDRCPGSGMKSMIDEGRGSGSTEGDTSLRITASRLSGGSDLQKRTRWSQGKEERMACGRGERLFLQERTVPRGLKKEEQSDSASHETTRASSLSSTIRAQNPVLHRLQLGTHVASVYTYLICISPGP